MSDMDLYELLGIARGATLIEIKRSYKRLARKYHPDINPGDNAAEARFKEITRAYETLTDPERRLRYDAGALSAAAASVSFEFEGFDFSGGVGHDGCADVRRSVRGGVLAAARGHADEAVRGADLHASVSLSFEEAMRGTRRQMTLTRRDTCQSCRGAGLLKIAEARCHRCQGIGRHPFAARQHGVLEELRSMRRLGTAAADDVRALCRAGRRDAQRDDHGRHPGGRQRRRADPRAGEGQRRRTGRAPGRSVSHRPRRAARDVRARGRRLSYTVAPIGVHEAALGARIEVPAPDGTARLRVPPGTQTGQRFHIRGRGAPSPRNGERGDLVVEVRIVLPKVLDERSKELLREFGRINDEQAGSERGEDVAARSGARSPRDQT